MFVKSLVILSISAFISVGCVAINSLRSKVNEVEKKEIDEHLSKDEESQQSQESQQSSDEQLDKSKVTLNNRLETQVEESIPIVEILEESKALPQLEEKLESSQPSAQQLEYPHNDRIFQKFQELKKKMKRKDSLEFVNEILKKFEDRKIKLQLQEENQSLKETLVNKENTIKNKDIQVSNLLIQVEEQKKIIDILERDKEYLSSLNTVTIEQLSKEREAKKLLKNQLKRSQNKNHNQQNQQKYQQQPQNNNHSQQQSNNQSQQQNNNQSQQQNDILQSNQENQQ